MEKEKILNRKCIFYPITHRLAPTHECYAWALVRPIKINHQDGSVEVEVMKVKRCKLCKIVDFMQEAMRKKETVIIYPDEISIYKNQIYIYE